MDFFQIQVFSFVHNTLHDAAVDSSERTKVRLAVGQRFPELVTIDAMATAKLALIDLPTKLLEVLASFFYISVAN